MATGRRRTGRRPGPTETREAIIGAAIKRFACDGYEKTTLRSIARDAGCDAALIVHFFGTKAGLFVAVARDAQAEREAELHELIDDGLDGLGERVVRQYVEYWDRTGERNVMLALLRSALDDAATADLLREEMLHGVLEQAALALDLDEPTRRSALVASQLIGVGIARYVLRLEPLTSASADEVVQTVGPIVQRYFGDALPAVAAH